jgi:CubicO group peptidase (beta-lactamase class C family)
MEKGALFHSMSVGKQFTSALALNRVERGDLQLTTLVKELIPEFATRGKNGVNLYHLLTHTGGIITDIAPGITWDTLGDLEHTIKAICATPALYLPGTRFNYAGYAGHALMAEMMRRREGSTRPWRQLLAEEFFEPLGMNDSAAGLPDARRDRICPVTVRGTNIRDDVKMVNQIVNETFEVPAGGCTITAEDVYRFAAMLLNDGDLEGLRYLSPATLELAAQNHTGDDRNMFNGREVWDREWLPVRTNYGMGFFTRGEGIHCMPFGTLASPHTFGGLGHASTMFWVDPVRDLCMVFLSTGLIDDLYHFERCQRYSDIVFGALERWPGRSPDDASQLLARDIPFGKVT